MKKVSVVVFSYYLEDTRVRKQCVHLAKNNYQVTVYCLGRKDEKKFEVYEGVEIVRAGNERKSKNRSTFSYVLEYISFFLIVFYLLTKKNLIKRDDIVFVHNMPNFLIFTALVPKLNKVPIVLDTHDLMPELWVAMGKKDTLLMKILLLEEKLSHKFATKLITVNKTLASYLTNRTGQEYSVFHNGPLCPNVKISSGLHGYSLVYHGNIHERYGLQHLVDVLPNLKKLYPSLTLDIYGYGPYAEEIQKKIDNLKINSYCIMHGRFKPEDVDSILEGKTIGYAVIDKCQQNDLAIPVKVLEYITKGIPVVTSNLETMQNYFGSDAVNYVKNKCDILDTYVNLLENRNQMKQQVQKAQNAIEKISWAIESDNFLDFVNNIVK